ncbi:MAG: hypothetical protein AAB719_02235 [Patescibacteria group bacterium]
MFIKEILRDSLGKLDSERLLNIDMFLPSGERSHLNDLVIDRRLDQFDFFGLPTKLLKSQLERHLAGLGDNSPDTLSSVAGIVLRLSQEMCQGFGGEAVWTMVRAQLPANEFVVPRWHPDGKYFASEKKCYKLATTLKGPQTLFGVARDEALADRLIEEASKNYMENLSNPDKFDEEDLRIRKKLAEVVEPLAMGGAGGATIYLVGDADAVLHSEPNITEPRLLVTVLSGSRKQISEWRERQKKL